VEAAALLTTAEVVGAADVTGAGAELLVAAVLLTDGFGAAVLAGAGAEVLAAALVEADEDADDDAERPALVVVDSTETGEAPGFAFVALRLAALDGDKFAPGVFAGVVL